LNDEHTQEFDQGWLFFYNTRRFLRTRSPMDCGCGNYPIIVDKVNGALYFTGPRPVGYYLDLFKSDKTRLTRLD
jgi:hypothetical protein